MTSYERELGRLQSDMENANENIKRLEGAITSHAEKSEQRWNEISDKLDKFSALISEGRGAKRVLVLLMGAAGGLASIIGSKILVAFSIIK